MGILNDMIKRDLVGKPKKEDWIIKMRSYPRNVLYLKNKDTKTGEACVCPICKEAFTKKQYSQAFCSIQCKDKFYNDIKKGTRNAYYKKYNIKHPERLERIGVKVL